MDSHDTYAMFIKDEEQLERELGGVFTLVCPRKLENECLLSSHRDGTTAMCGTMSMHKKAKEILKKRRKKAKKRAKKEAARIGNTFGYGDVGVS